MDDDASLIRSFIEDRSEEAFTTLVQRHVALVYSAALRQLGGDAHRAHDATQVVFCELARQASRLKSRPSVAGWLYNTARFVAARLRRSEERRKEREARFSMDISPIEPDTPAWKDIEPLIDAIMHELSAADREALVLRFFENQSLSSVGALLRLSDDGARMRVNRALEKLRRLLERHGVKSSGAVLGTLLAAHAVSVPPAALASALIGPALATGASTAGVGLSLLYFMTSAKLKIAGVAIACALVGSGYFLQAQQKKALREELLQSRTRIAEVENSQPVTRSAPDPESGRSDKSELLRLRGEVTRLREELARKREERAAAAPPSSEPSISPAQQKEINRTIGLAKMNLATAWGMALHKYAAANNGRMAAGFDEAATYLPPIPDELSWIQGVTGARDFEIVYQGSLDDLTNSARAIIVRERQPFDIDSSGAASRTYLFADGHTEVHRAPDGNFESWEGERMITSEKQ